MAVVAAVILMMPGTAQAEERPWREIPLPALWPEFQITEVAGVAPNEAWIAGFEGRGCVDLPPLPPWGAPSVCSQNAIVRKWNGTRWENKNPPGLWNLQVQDLEASSRTNVWLTGSEGSYLARWDGSRWTRVEPPSGCDYASQIHPVGADELWAVFIGPVFGDSCLARWKAGAWQVHTITGRSVHHVGSTGPGEIVIGTNTTDGNNIRATYRYTGSGWEPLPIPPSHPALLFTGHGARYYGTWNQQDLRKVTTAGTETILPPPSGAGSYLLDDLGRLWAQGNGVFYRYDGTAWQTISAGLTVPPLYDWTSLPGTQGVLWAIGATTTDDTRTHHILTNG